MNSCKIKIKGKTIKYLILIYYFISIYFVAKRFKQIVVYIIVSKYYFDTIV